MQLEAHVGVRNYIMNRIETISQTTNLKKAWDSLRRNNTSRGYDDVTIADFKADLDANILEISNKLKAGKYKFSAVRGVALPKPGSTKKRPIRVANVSDRVVQKAIDIAIGEELMKTFKVKNDASFAYIKDRGLLKAVGYINQLVADGYEICFKGDIQNYFGEVNTRKLLDEMVFPALGKDSSLNSLIEESLKQEVGNIKKLRKLLGSKQAEQIFPMVTTGIPQGGILSPLFSNIYLRELDEGLLDAGFKIVRYADDFVVLTKTLDEALAAYDIAQAVTKKLDLKLHLLSEKNIITTKQAKTKTYITRSNNFEFLGIAFINGKLYPSTDTFKKMRTRLKQQTTKSALQANSLGQKLSNIEQLTNSWARTYWFTDVDKTIKDKYIGLNNVLMKTVKIVVESNGLIFKSEKLSDPKKLKQIGLSKFESRLQSINGKYLKDKNKVELVKIFKPSHKIE